ncbi:MAG: prepilin-type N-terminal cleavage/methylation domain-containing protein [Candidatus Omnitrophica bacterium]|nr:prepilin-type N-terminal cleavage/methylation domain-containing protein [Candidatus Omnitrophota bacterium]
MKKSFTLIELLIVIVIIGILASLAIPKLELMVIRARETEARGLLELLVNDMIQNYYCIYGKVPDREDIVKREENKLTGPTVTIPYKTMYFEFDYSPNGGSLASFTATAIWRDSLGNPQYFGDLQLKEGQVRIFVLDILPDVISSAFPKRVRVECGNYPPIYKGKASLIKTNGVAVWKWEWPGAEQNGPPISPVELP